MRLAMIFLFLLAGMPPTVSAGTEALIEDIELKNNWTGDFDGMTRRGVVRVLVVHNKMLYFLDQGTHRGVNVDLFRELEKHINTAKNTGPLKVRVLFIPVPRDQLLSALIEGRGDIAAANLTITPERKETVDFSQPLLTGVKEILVTGPAAPKINTVEDLSGKEIHLRASSSYHEHVVELNKQFERKGKPPIEIVPASEMLEDGPDRDGQRGVDPHGRGRRSQGAILGTDIRTDHPSSRDRRAPRG
jgi:ABC-type amino acid transport substrate-binding protein